MYLFSSSAPLEILAVISGVRLRSMSVELVFFWLLGYPFYLNEDPAKSHSWTRCIDAHILLRIKFAFAHTCNRTIFGKVLEPLLSFDVVLDCARISPFPVL